MKRRVVLLTVALLVPAFLFAAMAFAAEAEKAATPAPAPPKPEPKYLSLTFGKVGGGEATIKSLLKKERTLLVFFQTACITCKTELEMMKKDLADHPKADVVGIAVDVHPEPVGKFVADMGFPKTVLLDPQFSLGLKVKVTYTPAAAVLDKDGQLVAVVGGFTDGTMDQIKGYLK